ncbi:MAG: sensor histidine kinase [Gammaproteobacteria bacterium]
MRPSDLGAWRAWALGLVGALPLLALAVTQAIAVRLQAGLIWLWLALAIFWLMAMFATAIARRKRRLQLLASLLQSLREGDYSLRARLKGESFREVWHEFNALAAHLGGEQRFGIETNALLAQLLAALDFAVLVVDDRERLVDLNPAAEQLLGDVATALIGKSAGELRLSDWLTRDSPFMDSREFAGGSGPWEVRALAFRRGGRPHYLLVITDVSHALREEERRVWRRLVRVLGHEINNSLGPIQSTANLLKERHQSDAGLVEGLDLIERRSQALGAFIRRYADLARLPPPELETVHLAALLKHVVSLETRLPVQLESDEPLVARADPDQLEQALINLVRNATDAALETGGGVRVRGRAHGRHILIEIEDDGPGIAQAENLFVPFYTTKPGGSGIGLVLARQIIEAHGGSLRLANRRDDRGTVASLRLPL